MLASQRLQECAKICVKKCKRAKNWKIDFADVCIDDYNPLGDTAVKLDGFETPIGPISNMTDFYIVHRLEIECAKVCLSRGIEPPFWRSANVPGGDEFNQKNLEKYRGRIKML